MPAAWQRWMPLEIDQLWGSANVQQMSGAAFKGYVSLLTAQWQSEDGSIPNDAKWLWKRSRLSPKDWEDEAESILENFVSIEGDQLRNNTCHDKWLAAKKMHEAKSEGRRKYLEGLKEDSSKTLASDLKESSKTQAYNNNNNNNNSKDKELLASHPSGCSAETSFISLPTNRQKQEFQVLDSHLAEWGKLYPGIDVRQQVRNMRGWLDGNPVHRKTLKGTPAFIHRWLGKAQDKATVPLPATGTQSKPFDPCTPKETAPSGITSDQVEQWRRDKAEGKVIPAHAVFAVERIEKREARQ